MNLKSTFQIDITKNERYYTFTMPAGAPIGEAYDVAHELLQALVKMAADAAERARQVTTGASCVNPTCDTDCAEIPQGETTNE
jgi:hypothetical protein